MKVSGHFKRIFRSKKVQKVLKLDLKKLSHQTGIIVAGVWIITLSFEKILPTHRGMPFNLLTKFSVERKIKLPKFPINILLITLNEQVLFNTYNYTQESSKYQDAVKGYLLEFKSSNNLNISKLNQDFII